MLHLTVPGTCARDTTSRRRKGDGALCFRVSTRGEDGKGRIHYEIARR